MTVILLTGTVSNLVAVNGKELHIVSVCVTGVHIVRVYLVLLAAVSVATFIAIPNVVPTGATPSRMNPLDQGQQIENSASSDLFDVHGRPKSLIPE